MIRLVLETSVAGSIADFAPASPQAPSSPVSLDRAVEGMRHFGSISGRTTPSRLSQVPEDVDPKEFPQHLQSLADSTKNASRSIAISSGHPKSRLSSPFSVRRPKALGRDKSPSSRASEASHRRRQPSRVTKTASQIRRDENIKSKVLALVSLDVPWHVVGTSDMP
jgi:hypothetical protein